MGNCFKKQTDKNDSLILLTCPYCKDFCTFNTKKFNNHTTKCIELDKYFDISIS